MPVNIDQVSAEVEVAEPPASGGAATRPLGSQDEAQRWRLAERRIALDETRTRAVDFDD